MTGTPHQGRERRRWLAVARPKGTRTRDNAHESRKPPREYIHQSFARNREAISRRYTRFRLRDMLRMCSTAVMPIPGYSTLNAKAAEEKPTARHMLGCRGGLAGLMKD